MNIIKRQLAPNSAQVIIVVLIAAALVSQTLAQGPNLLQNGGFEDGFAPNEVAEGWASFRTGNAASSFHDDQWELVVVEGEHSQMLEIAASQSADSYAGIYQNIAVTPGQTYRLSFRGLVRSDEGSVEASSYGYRLQYAIDLSGNQDWNLVTDWVELPWDEQPRTEPESAAGFTIESLETEFTATGDSATIFIRAWKKWANSHEGNYNIDIVRVEAIGSSPATAPTTTYRDPVTEPLPVTGNEDLATNPAQAVWLAASAVLVLLLIGGVWYIQKRRVGGRPRV